VKQKWLQRDGLLVRLWPRALDLGAHGFIADVDLFYSAFVGVGLAARQAVAVVDLLEGLEKLLPPPGIAVRFACHKRGFFGDNIAILIDKIAKELNSFVR